jgi:hypothetical protein
MVTNAGKGRAPSGGAKQPIGAPGTRKASTTTAASGEGGSSSKGGEASASGSGEDLSAAAAVTSLNLAASAAGDSSGAKQVETGSSLETGEDNVSTGNIAEKA